MIKRLAFLCALYGALGAAHAAMEIVGVAPLLREVANATVAQGSDAGEMMRGSAGTARSERAMPDEDGEARGVDARERWAMTHRASKIIGTKVRNPRGEDLGDVKELVLNPNTGDLSYAVVSFGGVLGLGDKLFAVPWKALRLDERQGVFVLDVAKDRLKHAPGFDPDRWPDMANAQWNTDVHRFYGKRYSGSAQSGRIGANPQREADGASNSQ